MTGPDSLYHRLFSHPVMVEQLVREFLTDVVTTDLDFSAMERVVAKFHGPSGDRREGDVIWRLPTTDGTDIYLYLLLEFQSQSDRWMAVRTLVYQGLLWQQVIAEQGLKASDRLPPVLLVVLYNGAPRWTAPAALSDLIALPDMSPLWHWQPQAQYHLIDVRGFPGDALERKRSLTALLFRLEQRQDPDTLAPLIDEVIGWFRLHPGFESLRSLFSEMVFQAIAGVGITASIPEDLTDMRTVLSTLPEYWKEKWRAELLAEGRAEGKAEGKAEGAREARALTLLRLVERRFGPVADAERARILAADSIEIDRWLDRLFDADSLDALLDREAGDPAARSAH